MLLPTDYYGRCFFAGVEKYYMTAVWFSYVIIRLGSRARKSPVVPVEDGICQSSTACVASSTFSH